MNIVFEIPILSWLFAKLGFISVDFMRRYWKQAVVIILMVVAIITPTMDNFINNLEKEIEKKLKTIESADLNIMKKSLETSQILVNAFQKVK